MGLAVATLAGKRVTSARVNIPAWGIWYADAWLDGEHTVSGSADLVISDLTLKGSIISGGFFQGRSSYRIVGGFGGWGKTLPKRSYANDAGMKISTILTDAATQVGESFDTATLPTTRVGPAWVREEGIASQTLEQLFPNGWYVGEDGKTRIGARPQTQLSQTIVHGPIDPAKGTVTIATDTIAKILPGIVIDGFQAVDVQHDLNPKGLRSTIWGKHSSGTSRRLSAFRALFDQLDPNRSYRGVFEYRVVTLTGNRMNLQPVRVSTGMPDLTRVPVRPGVAGAKSTVELGCRVAVSFLDGDPSRPFVSGYEEPDGEGFLPMVTEIDAQTLVKLGAGVLPVARTGDLAGIFPIVTTQVKVLA